MNRKSNHKHIYTPVLSCHRNTYRIGEGDVHTSEMWMLIGKCTLCGHYHEVPKFSKEFSWLDSFGFNGSEKINLLKQRYPIDEDYDFLNNKK